MSFGIEKIVLTLLGIPALCCGLMLLALLSPRPGLRYGALGLALVLLWGGAMPWTASQLMLGVRRHYPPVRPSGLPRAPLIVLLGGGLEPPGRYRLEAEWNDAGDRLPMAARLFHAGRAPRVLVSGGSPATGSDATPTALGEAVYMRRALVELGVPAAAVVEEGASLNTRQNARFVARWLEQQGTPQGPVLLVTSAWHMARAADDFHAAGVVVIPAPCDYPAMPDDAPGVRQFLPSADALAVVQRLEKEAIGRLARRLKVTRWAGPGDEPGPGGGRGPDGGPGPGGAG